MNHKIKIAAVSFLNTKPLTYGLETGDVKDRIELNYNYPSEVALSLIENKVDIALLPVEALLSLKEYFIISDYCISTEGEVASVCLFSEVPLENIQKILLDYQSRTSVALLKILLKEYWNISLELIASYPGYESDIGGTTAGLIIGDRALKQRRHSKYIYDLGIAWRKLTDMPFVFAVWVANKKMDDEFIEQFNSANACGVDQIDQICMGIDFPDYDLHTYFTQNIHYQLNQEKRTSIAEFLNRIKKI